MMPPLPRSRDTAKTQATTVVFRLLVLLSCAFGSALFAQERLLPGQLPRYNIAGGTIFRCLFDPTCDAEDGNRWPDHWQRKRGIDAESGVLFPDHMEIVIVDDRNPFGNHALRMTIQGGGAAAFTPKIPIRPGMSYCASAYVDAAELNFSEIYVLVSFYGEKADAPLKTVSSDRIRSTDGWRLLDVGPIVADMPGVQSISVGLLVIPRGRQDFNAVVRFTNLEIRESPTISLSMPNEHHLFGDPKDIEITCRLRGIDPLQHSVVFHLEDPFGRVIAQKEVELMIGNKPASQFIYPKNDRWDVFEGSALWSRPPVISPGFYRVRIATPERFVESLKLPRDVFFTDPLRDAKPLTFAVLPPGTFLPEGEFGWNLDGWELSEILRHRSLLEQSGLSRIKIPAWLPDDSDRTQHQLLNRLCDGLARQQVRVVGLLRPVPQAVRDRIPFGPVNAATLFTLDPTVWSEPIQPTLRELSLLVKDWQWTADDDLTLAGIPDFFRRFDPLRRAFDKDDFGFGVGFAWHWNQALPDTFRRSESETESSATALSRLLVNDFVSLTAENPLTADDMEFYLRGNAQSTIRQFVSVQALSSREYPLKDRVVDLVRRMIAGKVAGAEALFLSRPKDERTGVLRDDLTPSELFLPWQVTSTQISGKSLLGSIGLPNGSRNYIFHRAGSTVMVLWNETATEEQPIPETLFLGDETEIVDVWGKRHLPELRGREQIIPVGPIPVFVTGLDATVARLRLGFQLDRHEIPSATNRNTAIPFSLKNDTSYPFTAQLSMDGPTPDAWKITPATLSLALDVDRTESSSFNLSLTNAANTGLQPIRIRIKTIGAEPREFAVYDEIQIGEKDVFMEFTTRMNRQGDLEITQAFVNNSERSYTYSCRLYVPNRAYQRSSITRQGFGRREHIYTIPKGRELLAQGAVEATVRARPVGSGQPMVYTIPLRPIP